MNTQSGEAPLLFKMDFAQLWSDLYFKYYGQRTGWMAGFVLFAFNMQLGAGRNSVTMTIFNFNATASWNARRKGGQEPVIQVQGPKIEMHCAMCNGLATAVTPICESCMDKVTGFSRA